MYSGEAVRAPVAGPAKRPSGLPEAVEKGGRKLDVEGWPGGSVWETEASREEGK